jgi:large subunit ribosomal protein L15
VKLHELQPAPGSHHRRKRVGRGPGSGHGKTSTRGQKGQRARTSVNLPKTFEGGQTRLTMRTPKLRGFHNRWKKRFAVLNLTRLNRFEDGAEIRPETLLEAGFIKDVGAGIKVLGTGDLNRKLTIHAHRFSVEARRKIEAAGGTVAVIEVPAPIRPKTKRAKNQPKPVVVAPAEKEPSEAEDEAPAKESKKEKAEKGSKPEKAERAAKTEQGARAERADTGDKAEKRERGEKGQATRASDSEDSPKPGKGKKKS